jgi:hypothetical protein
MNKILELSKKLFHSPYFWRYLVVSLIVGYLVLRICWFIYLKYWSDTYYIDGGYWRFP